MNNYSQDRMVYIIQLFAINGALHISKTLIVRLMKSWELPERLQRKAWETRQCGISANGPWQENTGSWEREAKERERSQERVIPARQRSRKHAKPVQESWCGRTGLPKPVPDDEHRDLGFNACPAGFWSCFVATFPWYFLVPSFWDMNVQPEPLYLRSM